MQQLAALLASPTESFDQLRRAYDESLPDQYRELVQDRRSDFLSSKSPSISPPFNHHHTVACSTANSSFSIDNILSSSPPRRIHANNDQHQQPDRYHHHQHHHHHHLGHQSTDERPRAYHSGTSLSLQSLPMLPLSQAFYGQCLQQQTKY